MAQKITWQRFEKIVLDYLREHGYPEAAKQCQISIGAQSKKPHSFDAGSGQTGGRM
jgi:hypothetical protein